MSLDGRVKRCQESYHAASLKEESLDSHDPDERDLKNFEKIPRPKPSSVPTCPSVIPSDELDARISELEQSLLDTVPQTPEKGGAGGCADLADADVDKRIAELESMLPGSQGLRPTK